MKSKGNAKSEYTLSLAIIAKNEEKNLPVLWQSVKHIVDEFIVVDTGSTDKTVEVAKSLGAVVYEEGDKFCDTLTADQVEFYKQYGVDVKEGDKIFNFSEARNFSFSKCTKQFILWLDCDDILVGSENLKRIINSNLAVDKQLGLHLLYKYEVDQYGNSVVEHYRERVFPNNGTFRWQGRIHEIIVPTIETSYITVVPNDCHVQHNIGVTHKENANSRNIKNLLFDLYNQKDLPDPRTLFYIAECLKILKSDKAITLYEQYVKLSGWDEEICLVCTRLADLYMLKGDNAKALDWAFQAIKARPDFPMAYATVASVYYNIDKVGECEHFAKLALELNQPSTMILVNQKHNTFTPLLLLAQCQLDNGDIRTCLTTCKKALLFEPLNEHLRRMEATCERMILEEKVAASFKELGQYLIKEGDAELALELVTNCIPATHEDDPRLITLRDTFHGELVKRVESAQELEKKPKIVGGSEVAMEYWMLIDDLKYFQSKKVLLYSPDNLVAKLLTRQASVEVTRRDHRTTHFERGAFDTVVIDQMFCHTKELPLTLERIEDLYAPKNVILIVPNQDDRGVYAYNPQRMFSMLKGKNLWMCMPIKTGTIYCSYFTTARKSKGSLGFICGDAHEEWTPLSIHTGIGGSEEAVIYLTKELWKLGYDVHVYNSINTECTYQGVHWKHHATLIGKDNFDVAILWRIPHFLESHKFTASKYYLWLHDVPQAYWFTPDRVAKIDGYIALSEYHKSLLPPELHDKTIVSSNGVDLNQFAWEIDRINHKVIYTSSYDRGLEHLLKIWPAIREEVPDAELHVYYGWGTFDKLRSEEHHKQWKSKMMEMLEKTPGVFEHGRIGQDKLAQEFLSAKVYAYPCHFEEISCISAMKAQVAGCVPLTTSYAALAETNLSQEYTVKGNPKNDPECMEEFKGKLIELLNKEVDHEAIAKKAWSKFAWSKVAKQWESVFSNDK